MYHYLEGRSLNLFTPFNSQAESLLSKAVKLDPSLVEAWNQLGDCFAKKPDFLSAKNCFQYAVSQANGTVRGKNSLQNLSVALRHVQAKGVVVFAIFFSPFLFKDEPERRANYDQALSLAKQALTLDMEDRVSWCMNPMICSVTL